MIKHLANHTIAAEIEKKGGKRGWGKKKKKSRTISCTYLTFVDMFVWCEEVELSQTIEVHDCRGLQGEWDKLIKEVNRTEYIGVFNSTKIP